MIESSGAQLVEVLRLNALDPRCSERTAADWAALRAWLGASDEGLPAPAREKLLRAWRGYLEAGTAPSIQLEPAFQHAAQSLASSDLPREAPPAFVSEVFDRLLASDADIRTKRIVDKSRRAASAPEADWWRSQSRGFRTWVFACVVWILAVALYVLIFDPYNNGSLSYMRSDELVQVIAIMALPVVAGAIKGVYDRYVR